MKKTVTIILMILLVAGSAFAWPVATNVLALEDAAEDNSFNRYDSALGITYLIGSDIPSLQYQHWVTPGFGYTINSGAAFSPVDRPVYNDSENVTFVKDYNLDFNLFGQLQWSLYTASTTNLDTRLYTWVLGGCVINHAPTEKTEYDGILGAGFGFDVNLYKHLSIPIEFGYLGVAPSNPNLQLIGNFGMRYRF